MLQGAAYSLPSRRLFRPKKPAYRPTTPEKRLPHSKRIAAVIGSVIRERSKKPKPPVTAATVFSGSPRHRQLLSGSTPPDSAISSEPKPALAMSLRRCPFGEGDAQGTFPSLHYHAPANTLPVPANRAKSSPSSPRAPSSRRPFCRQTYSEIAMVNPVFLRVGLAPVSVFRR